MASNHYWEDTALKLYYNSSNDCSVDENGAKKYGKKATAPSTYVTDLQKDLIATGYLTGTADGSFGPGTKRALLRFQRRAKNSIYRVKADGVGADVAARTYTGLVNGICDPATAKTNGKALEWWHFHYNFGLEATFSDEMELVGVSEATLKANGWNSDDKLDHKPG